MTQPPSSQKLCKFEENGERCILPRSDNSYNFCSDHWLVARRERKREEGRYFRKDNPEQYNLIRWRCNHGLTKPKIRAFFDHAEILQEEYPHRDDFHEGALNDVNAIMWRLLNPPEDIASASMTAKEQTLHLLNKLKRQRKVYPDRMTDRLIGYAEELQRDSGKRISPRAFTEISGKAKEVLELWREQKEISGFIYALFVYVELNRLKFLAMPHERRFLNMAHRWLTVTADVCDQTINRCTGTHRQTTSFLAFCVPLLKTSLAFNGNEPEKAKSSI
jgi:hypothetical protein